ncbi:SpoIIE family protein phosphatase [Aeromicrobium sp. NPDC092404]|uniref:PP2C family protein-serine/threonine phosphatase n=1 Tax=Aeromicrobium sp. NPDC092404 TaxID=3154976 RepID=UPI00342BBC69
MPRDALDLFENAPCGYVEQDPDGTIIAANAQFLRLVARGADDVVGKSRFASFLTVGDRMFHETHFRPALQMHGEVHEIAFELVRPDGSTVPVLVSSNLGDSADRSVIRTIVFEARERRSYEQELLVARQEAERAEARSSELAHTLQQTFIPPAPPIIDGLEVAAEYRPAGDGSEVGGDFYDIFQIGGNEWVIVLGDVVGKGVEAAALTTFVTHALRAIAMQTDAPSAMLTVLNRALTGAGRDRFCTVAVLRLLREGDRWLGTVSVGGHPLPILRHRDGSVREVGTAGSLVGALDAPTFVDDRFVMEPGDSITMFTDGVTEARHGPDWYGDQRLTRIVAETPDSRDVPRRVLLDVMQFQGPSARDDIAVLSAIAGPNGPARRLRTSS